MAVNTCRSTDVPFRDVMAERLGLPVFVDNDANVRRARRASRTARRAGRTDVVLLTLGTGIGGGLLLGGELYRGSVGAGGRARPHASWTSDGPPVPGHCPNRGCLEAVASGTALGARGRGGRRAPAGLAARAGRWRSGREITGRAGHRARPRRRSGGPRGARPRSAARLGVGIVDPRERLQPGGRRDRRRRASRPASCCSARRARRSPSAPCARPRDSCAIAPAHFGAEAGMIGAAVLALDGARAGSDRRLACVSGRLVVCPTPIGNLEDVTLRVLVGAARGRRRGVRGHAPHADRCSIATGCSATLVSYHEHNERERSAELVERMRDGAVVALVSDAGMPLCQRSGLRARAGLRGRRARGRGAARALGGARRAGGARRCRPTAGASPASCRASAASCERVLRGRARRWSRSSRRAASRRRWRCWPSSIPSARSPSAAS